jgi:LacI family transcriptional regulator
VVLCNADEDEHKEARYVELALAEQAAGGIVSPHSAQTDVTPLLAASIPVVVIDRQLDEPIDTVLTDSRRGAYAATEHLLHQGWERPGCVTGPRSAQTANLRRLGYQDALRAGSIRTARVAHQPFTIDGGRAATVALLDQSRPPDALFVGNAALGLGVLHELRAGALRPGRDVGLICVDDAPWAPFIDPPISVVSQPAYRMGTQAATLLRERIEGAAHSPRRIVLGTDLIVRESSLRP